MADQEKSITELAHLFDMPAAAVRSRLSSAPTSGKRGNANLYRVADAAPYLVPPSEDLEAVIKGMRPDDLPVRLHDSFWGSMLKRQRYREEANDLWRTEDVESAFGKVFMVFREHVSLWAETVERQAGVTDQQREILVNMADDLMKMLHEELMNMEEITPDSGVRDEQEDKPDGE